MSFTGGIMKRKVACFVLAFTAFCAFAGDAAVFEDIGFSQDGNTYIFGQYGKTDKKFQAWAEIYTVDVAKNDFVKNEVYKTEPSEKTSEMSGKKAYEDLKEKSLWKMAKYNAKPCDASNLLYLRESEKKSPEEEIVFESFEESTAEERVFYHIKLVPEFEGKGKNVKSKFYISVKKSTDTGREIGSWKAGTPDFKRKGISSYLIDKIYTTSDSKSLVFVVQKTLEDDTGTSIRFMVETLRF